MTIKVIQPALQSYVSADTGSIYKSQSCPDFNFDRMYVYSFAFNRLFRFGLSSGDQEASATLVSQSPDGAELYSLCVDNQGSLYAPYDAADFTGISRIDPLTLKIVSSFGSSSSMDNTPFGVPGIPLLCSPRAGDIPFVFGGSLIPLGADALSTFVLCYTPFFGGANASVGGAPGAGAGITVCCGSVGNTGVAFALCTANASIQTNLYFYKTVITRQAALYDPSTFPATNTGIVNSFVGLIPATAVDPGFISIGQNGAVFDETDGNVIANVGGLYASGMGAFYLIKVDSSTAEILWKVPVAAPTADDKSLGFGSIKHGRMAYFSQGGLPTVSEIIFIDTLTGDYFTSSDGLVGVSLGGAQYFDDSRGAIFAYMTYSEASGGPIRLNNTPSTFDGWGALYVMAPPAPFVPGGRQTYTKIWGAPAGIPA